MSDNTPEQVPSPIPNTSEDILDLLRDGRHFANKVGFLTQIIDSLTGDIVVQYTEADKGGLPVALERNVLPTGETVWTENGRTLDLVSPRTSVYTPVVLDILCQRVAEGGAITEICKQPDMPTYNVLCRWRREHPEINLALEMARKDRAESMRDKALKTAEGAEGKDPISGDQLRVDTYKWAASTDDAARYSPKAKVEATVSVPTIIQVNTGIER